MNYPFQSETFPYHFKKSAMIMIRTSNDNVVLICVEYKGMSVSIVFIPKHTFCYPSLPNHKLDIQKRRQT